MARGNPHVRPARADDRKQLEAISGQAWDRPDYIPGMLNRWLKQEDGELSVAELENRVVGFSKFTVLTSQWGWLEGARVHPQWRRRGVATSLARYHIGLARQCGLAALGMATSSNNAASRRVMASLGFQLTGDYRLYRAPVCPGKQPKVEKVAELPDGKGLIPVGWTYWPWNRQLLQKWQAEGNLIGYGGAGMALQPGHRPNRVNIPLLWGPSAEAAVLLQYARCQLPPVEQVSFHTCEDTYHRQLLSAGFELREKTAVVYSLDL